MRSVIIAYLAKRKNTRLHQSAHPAFREKPVFFFQIYFNLFRLKHPLVEQML